MVVPPPEAEAVHEYDVDIKEYRLGYTYLNMVDSLAHEIDMVDPSDPEGVESM